ncbi:class I SAM-dependent methyltransferase [Bradyrhizobium manausense]|uniref:class I SAM-dependent methyltransferase n=1 Tax=Bradyrhizobium TaxID=374 RepID=UPI001BAD9C81|nr:MULTISPECIES: class I SAM-dependent methyltransferase [Bradyrhizobium]MBR0826919.1 class I SAM-dependent methyltransferase [Bradyrhizobium manausense]UVO32201.1 class I SAM-dependent methyltransferase [Bradyrhizobium arachidis]
MDIALTFDRTGDVSKLDGTNTRGIEYRWDIFKRHLSEIRPGSRVLDFGAGSLRESFDLVSRGFDVTSIDLDAAALGAYHARYQWPAGGRHRMVASQDMFSALSGLPDAKFALITCFDVLEHLEDPVAALKRFSDRMTDDCRLFISVPNGLSLFELAWRLDLKIARATGRYIRPGEPHLQRLSPARWKATIEASGLTVVDHELHIGFFANTSAALVQVPLALMARILRKMGANIDGVAVAERIIQRTAPAMDALDRRTRFLRGLYGWNLFVVSR